MTLKHLLPLLLFTLFGIQAYSQTISGGAGITHVTGDPDAIVATRDVSINESNICYDRTNQMVYFFDPSGTAGVDQWEGVSVTEFANTNTRLDNPTVSGGNLVFDILNVVTNTPTGAQVTIPILSIAPVQDITGGGDITVTDDGSGNFTVSFSETNTSLSYVNDTLVYTDESGTINKIAMPASDGSDTKVEGAGDITVTGTGTSADPYSVSFSETTTTLTFASDTLTFTDEDGTVNKIALPSSDGSDTQVEGAGDITVTGTGTSADPYSISFSETTTTLTLANDTLSYTDEDGTVNKLALPVSDGSDTQVEGAGDITVTGSGTSADPYSVSFSETTTTLTFASDTLSYTDEDGTLNKIALPASDGSDTKVEGAGDITVTGTGTAADPYSVSFTETMTSLTFSNDSLSYTDEGGTVNRIALPVSDGSDTQVEGANGVTVTGTGTSADPYSVVLTGAASATSGQIPIADGSGSITWSDSNITSIAADANGKLVATLSSGATVIFDLNSAPRVANMTDLDTAAKALDSGQTGIAVVDDGNTLGIPAVEDADVEIGALFFIKKK